jgi:hypothetical protein
MSKTAAIEFLKHQLAEVQKTYEMERRKMQEMMSRLPSLEAEANAIKLLLSKHAGTQDHVRPPSQTIRSLDPIDAVSSVSRLSVRALTEAGKPQTTAQILGYLASHGKQTSSATLRSTIYMSAKRGRIFKVISPGLYGLIEWKDDIR